MERSLHKRRKRRKAVVKHKTEAYNEMNEMKGQKWFDGIQNHGRRYCISRRSQVYHVGPRYISREIKKKKKNQRQRDPE